MILNTASTFEGYTSGRTVIAKLESTIPTVGKPTKGDDDDVPFNDDEFPA
jgi:hypothetical protein